jgi:mono/diheme cytochrome c family protein
MFHHGSKRLVVLSLIPALGVIAAITASAISLRPGTLWWRGVQLTMPVSSAALFPSDDHVLFETRERVPVRAAISGTISVESPRVFYIRAHPITVKYVDVTRLTVQPGEEVKKGQVIGRLETGHPDPRTASFSLEVLKDGSALAPPAFQSEFELGERLALQSCVGCHHMREVFPLDGKKMLNGQPATSKNVEETIRKGGKVIGPYKMPAFQDVLSDTEIKAVVSFVCHTRCVDSPELAEAKHRP